MNRDLTVGNPGKVMWTFCLPLFASVIFQQIYNIADSIIAGKFIGEEALAAVGNSYEITLIFLAFGVGCNVGCSVIVSNLFGAKELKKVKTAISTVMITSGIICLLLMGIGVFFGDGILKLIKTPYNIFEDSSIYLKIYSFGLPFIFFYNIANGIFSAFGDSKTPLIFLSISSVSNIFADILFVKEFNMGVRGVAWATFLCQGLSCIFALIFVFRRLVAMKTEGAIELFSKDILKQFTKIAVPSILQQSFISIGNIIIQRIINGFGSNVIAGYSAAIKLNNLIITSLSTIGNGISNFTAQNIGAEKEERVPMGLKAGVFMIWAIALPLTIVYIVFGKYLIGFFIDNPTELALKTGVIILRILAPFYMMISIKLASDGVLKGAMLMKQFMVGTFTDLVIRVVLAYLLSLTKLGSTGIWTAWPIGWFIATVISFSYYRKYKKTIVKKQ